MKGLLHTTALLLSCICLLETAIGHGSLHRRITETTAALAENPGDTTLLLQRAELHTEHQQFDEARSDLAQIIEADPTHAEATLLSAVIEFRNDDLKAARALLESCTSRSPKCAKPWLLLSQVEEASGDKKKAIAALESYFSNSNLSNIPQRLHWLALLEETGQSDRARTGFAKFVETRGPIPTLLEAYARFQFRDGDSAAGLLTLKKLRLQTPSLEFRWHHLEGQLWESIENTDNALASYRAAKASLDGLSLKRRSLPALVALRNTIEEKLGGHTK